MNSYLIGKLNTFEMYFITLKVIQKQWFKILSQKVREGQSAQLVNITVSHQDDVSKSYLLTLLYKGKRGEKILRNITKEVNMILPDKHKDSQFTMVPNLAQKLIPKTLLGKYISMT